MQHISLKQIARHLGTCLEDDSQVSGYQINSKLICPGDVFFALQGEKVDGHCFLSEVRQRGGKAAVVSKKYSGDDFGLALFAVEDVVESLQEMARFSLSLKQPKIIGITGSIGKTMTKEFLAVILEGRFRVVKNFSSYNTKLTLPLTILNRLGDEDVLVLEMGISEPGDLERLLSIAAPDVAVLTKIALSHAAQFPRGVSEIAQHKAKIFSHPKTKIAVFDHDFYQFQEEVGKISIDRVSFSQTDPSADYFLSLHEGRYLLDERAVRAYQFDLPFRQPHILHNILAAVSAARQMHLEWDLINQQIGKLQLPKMRFEQFEKEGIVFINDAYNANPDSMRAALSSLPEPKEGGKRIAVLGAMKELGPFSENCHKELGRFAQRYVDHLLVFSDEALPLYEAFQEVKKPTEFFADSKGLVDRLKALMSPGDVVLVKGSRSLKMESFLEHL